MNTEAVHDTCLHDVLNDTTPGILNVLAANCGLSKCLKKYSSLQSYQYRQDSGRGFLVTEELTKTLWQPAMGKIDNTV